MTEQTLDELHREHLEHDGIASPGRRRVASTTPTPEGTTE